MPLSRNSRSWLALLLLAAAPFAPAQQADSSSALVLAQKQITAYLAQLADLHCKETVTQEKLAPGNGHVLSTERGEFDYLIMMNGNADDFQLNESRLESNEVRHKLGPASMLVTNGISTALLVFHPYYRDGFSFELRPPEALAGHAAIPIHFTHIQGRRTPAALALRGREFPLELEGTAWLDEASGQVVQVDATLEHDMSEVGLSSLKIHVEYKPTALPGKKDDMYLPAIAVVDVTTPRQRWRNTHVFMNYRGFSTESEQDPKVKILPEKKADNDKDAPGTSPQGDTPKQ